MQKDREPVKLLTEEECRSLCEQEENFCWARGLVGGRTLDREIFNRDLVRQAQEIDPTFVSSF